MYRGGRGNHALLQLGKVHLNQAYFLNPQVPLKKPSFQALSIAYNRTQADADFTVIEEDIYFIGIEHLMKEADVVGI